MFYVMSDDDKKIIEEVSELTMTDYEVFGKTIHVEKMMAAIENLLTEVKHLEDKVNDLENDIANNYELKRDEDFI